MKTQWAMGQSGFSWESSGFGGTGPAGNVGSLATVTYTRGVDLSGTLQGAGGIGGLLARTDMGRLTVNDPLASAYYHADGNGNITALITDLMDTNQVLVAKYLYDSYGNLLAESGPLAGANKYRFSSQEWDSPAGLYYYLYRFYDPNLQRWPNRDPLGDIGFRILMRRHGFADQNLYSFNGNDPLDHIDAFGLYGSGADDQEKKDDICACGPWKAYKAYRDKNKAVDETNKRFHSGFHNGPADAWRHCYWSCLMARDVGQDCAKAVGDNHEAANKRANPPEPDSEYNMDTNNNSVGRGLASDSGDCGDLCQRALDDGKLTVLNP